MTDNQPSLLPEKRMVVYSHKLSFTRLLVVANAVIFLAMLAEGVPITGANGMEILHWGVDYGPLTLSGQYWRLWTSNYIHFGIFHIAFNMFCLWGLGRLTEIFYDWFDFILLYSFTGICSSLLSVWLKPDVISGGASGAVFGVAGVMLTTLKWGTIPVRPEAKKTVYKDVLKFALINLAVGAVVPRVDNTAHLGGLLSGLLVGAVMGKHLDPSSSSRRFRFIAWATLIIALVLAAAGVVHSRAHLIKKIVIRDAIANGQTDYALSEAITYVKQNPRDIEARILIATIRMKQAKPELAAEAYQDALKIQPNNQSVLFLLADVLTQAGKIQDAEAAWRKLVELNPKLPGHRFNLGLCLQLEKKNAEAEAAFRKAIEMSPQNVQYLYTLGGLLVAEKKFNEAVAIFRKAVAVNGQVPESHIGLAESLLGERKMKEAAEQVKQAAELYRTEGKQEESKKLVLEFNRMYPNVAIPSVAEKK